MNRVEAAKKLGALRKVTIALKPLSSRHILQVQANVL